MKRLVVAGALAAAVIVVAVVGASASFVPPHLSSQTRGDEALLDIAAPHLAGPRDQVAMCVVTPDGTSFASFGADEGTHVEVGSVTKTMTGELFADSIARGEVAVDTTLGELLPLDGTTAASITLLELATHRSGLGEWGDDARDDTTQRWWQEDVLGGTVHDISLPDLLDRASADPLSTRGEFSYSNAGVALLGHGLAAAADSDYATLVQQRVLDPLGMTDTWLASASDHNRPRGFSADGRRVPAWNLGAYAPAGSVFSTSRDMCRFASSLLDTGGSLPEDVESARVARVTDDSGDGVGLSWFTRTLGGEPVVWHDGQTSGFASTIVVGPEKAVLVLSNTASPVHEAAFALYEESP